MCQVRQAYATSQACQECETQEAIKQIRAWQPGLRNDVRVEHMKLPSFEASSVWLCLAMLACKHFAITIPFLFLVVAPGGCQEAEPFGGTQMSPHVLPRRVALR